MNIITGNLLDIPEGVLIHQVNCQKVAGAGLALAIRNKWPKWYVDYRNTDSPILGVVTLFRVNAELWIANLFAQRKYGHGQQTDYESLQYCLRTLALPSVMQNDKYYIPYGMGAGLAGGDWGIISQMIDEILPDATIVRLPNG